MLFWNRREIYHGFSLSEFNNTKDFLLSKNFKYNYRIINHTGKGSISGRGRIGSFSQNHDYDYEYYLYVHKNNYEEITYLLNNKN